MDECVPDGETQNSNNVIGEFGTRTSILWQLACKNPINETFSNSVRRFSAELQKKLAAIELENKNTRDEFNVQRAKLKEIFLQKEGLFIAC